MLRSTRKKDAEGGVHPTKQRLVEETARLIMREGLESVHVDEVLAAVGVTQGSLYHHFGSVNGLLFAGLLHAFEAAVRESEAWSLSLRDDCRTAREARDRLHEIVDASQIPGRRLMRSVRLHSLSMARTEPAIAGEIARLQAGLTDTLTGVYREFQQRGWARSDFDSRALAVLVQAMNLGRIVDDVVDDRDRVDSSAWIELYNHVLDGFFVIEDD